MMEDQIDYCKYIEDIYDLEIEEINKVRYMFSLI